MSNSTCRSCGAAIRWVETLIGNRMPLDPEPCVDGNVTLDRQGRAHVLKSGNDRRVMREAGRTLYKSHFATCPNADQHRSKPGAVRRLAR